MTSDVIFFFFFSFSVFQFVKKRKWHTHIHRASRSDIKLAQFSSTLRLVHDVRQTHKMHL